MRPKRTQRHTARPQQRANRPERRHAAIRRAVGSATAAAVTALVDGVVAA